MMSLRVEFRAEAQALQVALGIWQPVGTCRALAQSMEDNEGKSESGFSRRLPGGSWSRKRLSDYEKLLKQVPFLEG